MIQHLSLLNPFGRIDNEARASAAARGSAVALGLGAAISAYGALKIYLWPEQMREAMAAGMRAQPAPDPEAARMAEAMIPGMMSMTAMFGLIVAVVMLVLAWVQWRNRTRVIPIIFVCLGILGLLSILANLAMTASGMAAKVPIPLAETIISHAVTVACLLLHIGGWRGATWLASNKD